MAHPLLLGLDSFGRFTSRSFLTLPEPGPDGRTMGELTLSSHTSAGACVYATNEEAAGFPFHLVYSGVRGVSLGKEPVLVDVNLVRSSKLPALVGNYLVSFRPELGPLSSPDAFVSNGRQQIPMAGDANLEPGDLLGCAAAPLLRVPFDAIADFPAYVLRANREFVRDCVSLECLSDHRRPSRPSVLLRCRLSVQR